jgi:hypothetical protein
MQVAPGGLQQTGIVLVRLGEQMCPTQHSTSLPQACWLESQRPIQSPDEH